MAVAMTMTRPFILRQSASFAPWAMPGMKMDHISKIHAVEKAIPTMLGAVRFVDPRVYIVNDCGVMGVLMNGSPPSTTSRVMPR